jgi:hypothetical protein
MWGPPSAMFEEPSPQSHKGIVPRIFQLLFSELEKVCFISYLISNAWKFVFCFI